MCVCVCVCVCNDQMSGLSKYTMRNAQTNYSTLRTGLSTGFKNKMRFRPQKCL